MKKKVLSLLLAMTLSAGLVACGSKESTGSTDSTTNTATTDAKDSKTTSEEQPATAEGDSAGEITLGVIGPMTGSLAVYGTHIENGVELAVEQINAAGGVDVNGSKYKLVLESKDDRVIPQNV